MRAPQVVANVGQRASDVLGLLQRGVSLIACLPQVGPDGVPLTVIIQIQCQSRLVTGTLGEN
jgi:hypothetical protein